VSSTARMSTAQLATANMRRIIGLDCVENLGIVAFDAVGVDSMVEGFIADLLLTAIAQWAARHTKGGQYPAAGSTPEPGRGSACRSCRHLQRQS